MVNYLFLSESFYPHAGGAELASHLYAKGLVERKHKVRVITNRFANEEEKSINDGYEIIRIPFYGRGGSLKFTTLPRFNLFYSNFFRKMMDWTDVVYIPRFWFSAIPHVKGYGKPVITHLHDYSVMCPLSTFNDPGVEITCQKEEGCDFSCIYSRERRKRDVVGAVGSTLLNLKIWPFVKKYVSLSDSIVCVSEAQKKIILEHQSHLKNITTVIYNPLPKIKIIDMNGDDFGYFGGTNHNKGINVLLKALSVIKKSGHKNIVAHGTKFDNILKADKTKYRNLGLHVYGKLNNNDYDTVLKKIKAVIIPSIWNEPLPYVVGEAFLKGKLVVGSRIGGIPEQVNGVKGAFLFEPNDPLQLVEKMLQVVNIDRASAIELGYENRKAYLKKYNNDSILRKFIKISDNIVSSN